MSEIIFRGVSKSLKVWVHGSYDQYRVKCYPAIYSVTRGKSYDIIPETLGQFIGKHDNNGVDIYTGDIVSDHNGFGVVKYSSTDCAFYVSYGSGEAKWFIDYTVKGELESITVIGSIHDKEATNE